MIPLHLFTSGALWLACAGAAPARASACAADNPPPGSLPAVAPAELRVAAALRRSRADRSLDPAELSAEIAAGGEAVLGPCLNTLELGWVAACAPGELPQILSRPQIEIVLAALASLEPAPVLAEVFARSEAWPGAAMRVVALQVLGAVGDSTHLTRLAGLALSEGEEHPTVRGEEALRQALAGILKNDARAFERLNVLLRDIPQPLAVSVVTAVGDAADTRGLAFIEHVLTFHPELGALCAAQVRRIGRSGMLDIDGELSERLRWMLDPARPAACGPALLALGELRDYDSIAVMIELLSSDERSVSGNALWALQRMTGLNFPALPGRWTSWYTAELAWFEREEASSLNALHEGRPKQAVAAIRALSERHIYRDELAYELSLALTRPEPELRAPICRALERLGAQAGVPALVELLDDDEPMTAQAAWHALTAITGRKLAAESPVWRSALAIDA